MYSEQFIIVLSIKSVYKKLVVFLISLGFLCKGIQGIIWPFGLSSFFNFYICFYLVISLNSIADVNVISVDWERLAGPSPYYVEAALNTEIVGNRTGDLMNWFIDEFDAKLEDFYPVGWSLGGQVVGHLGHHLDGQLPRITGLDPAGK